MTAFETQGQRLYVMHMAHGLAWGASWYHKYLKNMPFIINTNVKNGNIPSDFLRNMTSLLADMLDNPESVSVDMD